MWPFNKTIKITFEPSKSSLAKKKLEDETRAAEALAKKIQNEANQTLLKKLTSDYCDSALIGFLAKVPQPFQVGDSVMVKYYGSAWVTRGGWLSTGYNFINTFTKEYPDIKGPMVFEVKKIWADTSWLYDKLINFDFNYGISESELKTRFRNYANSLFRIEGLEPIQWAIDFDWEKLNFCQPGSAKFLDLKWGGLLASSFLPANSDVAKQQVELFKAEQEVEKARAAFKEQEAKLEAQLDETRGITRTLH